MSSKNFDLFVTMIIKLLETGSKEDVIAMLKESQGKPEPPKQDKE